MSIDISRNEMLRSERTLICPAASATHARDRPSRYGNRGAFFSVHCEGQALALRGPGRFFRRAGACPPQSLPHPGHPDNPGHPASDEREINSIDIQV